MRKNRITGVVASEAAGASTRPSEADPLSQRAKAAQEGTPVAPIRTTELQQVPIVSAVVPEDEALGDWMATPAKPTFDDLPGRIKAARQSASQLNTVTDNLNRSIGEVEAALVALRLGVQADIDLYDEDSSDGEPCRLAFRKHDGNWCLLIEHEHPDDPTDVSKTPIAKASRALRIQTAGRLPALVNQLIENTSTQVQIVQESADTLSVLAVKLREAQS
jgi:hypothetical protein